MPMAAAAIRSGLELIYVASWDRATSSGAEGGMWSRRVGSAHLLENSPLHPFANSGGHSPPYGAALRIEMNGPRRYLARQHVTRLPHLSIPRLRLELSMSRSSRRQFLSTSAASAGALALGAYVNPTAAQQSKSPNERLRIGAVGTTNRAGADLSELMADPGGLV